MSENSAGDGILQLDLAFPYRFYGPRDASDDCLLLLHGSGVDETTMVPIARRIAPHAMLIAVRGRIVQEDGFRWFTRITPTSFEQESIRTEAAAFADFVGQATRRHDLALSRTTFLGYSNGANLVSSVMLLHPGLVERAALLRPMPVLDEVPATDLSKCQVLVIAGASDLTYSPYAPALIELLDRHGAELRAETIASGHEIGDRDAEIIRQWLAAPLAQAD